jgi:hypothetical protein
MNIPHYRLRIAWIARKTLGPLIFLLSLWVWLLVWLFVPSISIREIWSVFVDGPEE